MKLPYLLVMPASIVAVYSLSHASTVLTGYLLNEATEADIRLGVETRLGDYTSDRNVGLWTIPILMTLRLRPDRSSCLADGTTETLRWSELSKTGVEVCVGRITAEKESDKQIFELMKSYGFRMIATNYRTNPDIQFLVGVCSDQSSPCHKSLANMWFTPYGTYAYTIGIKRRANSNLGVRVEYLSK